MHDIAGGWPSSTRTLVQRIQRRAGTFWPNVMYTHEVDLSDHDLPGCDRVKFTFVDPMFVWIRCVNALLGDKKILHWNPRRLVNPDTEQELWGAGIQFGMLFRNAHLDIPNGGNVALVNISWDGGGVGFGSRSAVPILIQVMNTNSSSTKGVGLLGYLPYIEVSEGIKNSTKFLRAKRFVLQVNFYLVYLHVDVCNL